MLNQISRISKFRVANKLSTFGETQEFFSHCPSAIIVGFMLHMPTGDPKTPIVGRNVFLIHPLLGTPDHTLVLALYENQLEWIAKSWKDLCAETLDISGRSESTTPLLIGGGEYGTFIIDTDGTITQVEKVPYQPLSQRDLLISELSISERTKSRLIYFNSIVSVSEVLQRTEKELLDMRQFGPWMLEDLERCLLSMGLLHPDSVLGRGENAQKLITESLAPTP